MKYQKGNALVGLLYLFLFIFMSFGWIWNIVKIVQTMSDAITGMFILRIVGIFAAPLGAVLGYL